MRSTILKVLSRYCIVFIYLLLLGCSRGDVSLFIFSPTETPLFPEETQSIPTMTPISQEKYPSQREYAAVWVSEAEGLQLRSQAGISTTIVETVPWNSHEIYLTSNRSLLGSSQWFEITTVSGTTGWVNAWNLTEYVPSDQFCKDSRIDELLGHFLPALLSPGNSSLVEFISPNRGLTFRINWYSPDVTFSLDTVDLIFSDVKEIDWGSMADSGLQIVGSYETIIYPKLEDVFTNASERLCNELKWGSTAGEVIWPDNLENINFYAFYRPAEEDGNEFSWRTWAIGIEYVNDQPYVAILVHYSSEL